MPTLDWIGKSAVVNHHREVPYHLLRCDEKLTVGDPDSGNLLVQGDNLLALKALLPYYAGQVKCIYIDPPYNTGNENWVYNVNVNSPEIRKWLGKVVEGEAEDLSRHDKWLCMMYPRLALLREFLTPDGARRAFWDPASLRRCRRSAKQAGRVHIAASRSGQALKTRDDEMSMPKEIKKFIERFQENRDVYCSSEYNEAGLTRLVQA